AKGGGQVELAELADRRLDVDPLRAVGRERQAPDDDNLRTQILGLEDELDHVVALIRDLVVVVDVRLEVAPRGHAHTSLHWLVVRTGAHLIWCPQLVPARHASADHPAGTSPAAST